MYTTSQTRQHGRGSKKGLRLVCTGGGGVRDCVLRVTSGIVRSLVLELRCRFK